MAEYITLDATVEICLQMVDGETEEEASERLYDVLYSNLCHLPNDHLDFWIMEAWVRE